MRKLMVIGAMASHIKEALDADKHQGLEIVAVENGEEAMRHVADTEIVFCLSPDLPDAFIAQGPHLRWIQAMTAGTDHLELLPSFKGSLILSSARGMHGPQVSEMAILHMMALSRNVARMLDNQRATVWHRWEQPLLWSKTVAIVGIGTIAEALARRCKAFGMHVIGITDTVRPLEDFDEVVPRTKLASATSEADFLVVLAPYNKRNHHLIDAKVLAAMKPSAILVNLARGGVVDEAALLDALQKRAIAAAGLDVFATEPLPPDHPFWKLDNAMLTPHLGGLSDVYVHQVLPLLRRNLATYLAGGEDRLENLASPARQALHKAERQTR